MTKVRGLFCLSVIQVHINLCPAFFLCVRVFSKPTSLLGFWENTRQYNNTKSCLAVYISANSKDHCRLSSKFLCSLAITKTGKTIEWSECWCTSHMHASYLAENRLLWLYAVSQTHRLLSEIFPGKRATAFLMNRVDSFLRWLVCRTMRRGVIVCWENSVTVCHTMLFLSSNSVLAYVECCCFSLAAFTIFILLFIVVLATRLSKAL